MVIKSIIPRTELITQLESMTRIFKQMQIFGDQANAINEGDVWIANVEKVEGKKVITLKPKADY